MALNVLQLITEVCNRNALRPPNTVIGSNDVGIIQLGSLLNEEGQELSRRYPWQIQMIERTWSSVATMDQGPLVSATPTPLTTSDNYEYIWNQIIWNRSTRLPIFGPNSPDKRQARAALPLTGPYTEYFIREGHLWFNPAPNAAGQTLALEFKTKNWLLNQAGTTGYSVITNDTDVIQIDETCIILGLQWRWKAMKGLDYGEDFNKYERAVADAMSRDGTKPVLSLDAGELNNTVQPVVVIPSGGWNII